MTDIHDLLDQIPVDQIAALLGSDTASFRFSRRSSCPTWPKRSSAGRRVAEASPLPGGTGAGGAGGGGAGIDLGSILGGILGGAAGAGSGAGGQGQEAWGTSWAAGSRGMRWFPVL